MPEEFQDAFQPAHQLPEETIVVNVYFVHEFVEVVLVPCAEVDERLNGLIGIGGDILTLGFFDNDEHIVCKVREVRDAVVDIGGLVHADERFVEDGE